MNKYKYVPIIICGLAMFLSAQQTFPVCAFHVKDSTWFDSVGEDSLGLNTILFHDVSFSKEKIIGLLNAADDRDLKVIVGHVRKGSASRDDMLWYCQLHWGLWEAEDSSNFFHASNWWNGTIVEDTFAHNDTAFVAFVDSQDNQQMLKTLRDYARPYSGSWFNAIFHLKITAEGIDDTVSVCSLMVTPAGHTPYVADTILRVGDFAPGNQYQPCTLSYYMSSSNNRYFCIKWLDNCDLWCDYIETKDRWIDSLLVGFYDDVIVTGLSGNQGISGKNISISEYQVSDESQRQVEMLSFLSEVNEYFSKIQPYLIYRNHRYFTPGDIYYVVSLSNLLNTTFEKLSNYKKLSYLDELVIKIDQIKLGLLYGDLNETEKQILRKSLDSVVDSDDNTRYNQANKGGRR